MYATCMLYVCSMYAVFVQHISCIYAVYVPNMCSEVADIYTVKNGVLNINSRVYHMPV